jgi:hypothetical protein
MNVFEPKRRELAAGWRELHREEMGKFQSSLCIIRVIELGMRWARHVARIAEL